ncbi:MAG: ADP-ribosylglycohydrolase family protein [Firmicutes bacterium]|nr:ADP-ribosylglycohydrolase family protein [Bacillota bacterium]
MSVSVRDKILGSLVAAAIGDAMGAPTEQMTLDEIKDRFGGRLVDRFYAPSEDRPFSHGRLAGQITDDTGQMLELARAFIEAGTDPITPQQVADALLRWAADPEVFSRFAGPTTRQAIERLRAGEDPLSVGRSGTLSTIGTSNGCAMKVAPAGLIHPGDPDSAVRDACTVCMPTHATQIAMSGASAIASGISAALAPGADVFSVVRACLYGAREGEKRGRAVGRVAPGPSVEARIRLAVRLALESSDIEDACRSIHAYVGSGLHTAEAVPAAVGLFVAAGGDPAMAVAAGASIGDDTDTVATMAGALAGALGGISRVPADLYRQVEEVNHLDIAGLADEIYSLAIRLHPAQA